VTEEETMTNAIVAEGLVKHFGDTAALDGVDPTSVTPRSADTTSCARPTRSAA
jgi:hypothetical protein